MMDGSDQRVWGNNERQDAVKDASKDGGYVTEDGRQIGGVLMELRNITLKFGGVVAIKDISFDIREGEIRAIIGPNGAGKSSMLNIISGFYTPSEGELWYKGSKRPPMKPYEVARLGVARTFQIGIIKRSADLASLSRCSPSPKGTPP